MAKKAVKKTAKAKEGKAPAQAQELIAVSSKALSTDLGPVIVASLAKTYDEEAKANEMLKGVDAKRYDLLANTTMAIVKAYEADESISSSAAFSPDKKTVQKLNDQLCIALGVREYQDIKGKQKLVYSKAVSRYFPTAKDPKGAEATVRKATLRSNFVHMLKKCAQAATAIVEKDMEASVDKETGTLLISGPTVEKAFGVKEVLLNEKQNIKVDGQEKPLELKQRPSFTALGNIAAVEHGAVIKGGSSDRTKKAIVDPDLAMESLADTVVKAVSRLSKLTDKQRTALESMQSAIDKVLNRE